MIKLLGSIIGVALVGAGFVFNAHEVVKPVAGYEIGDFAEDFTLKNIDGNMVSLSDYQDEKGVVVIFTCNSCPYAKMYEDRIIALHEQYKEKGYPVLAIMPNDVTLKPEDSFPEMKKRAMEKSYGFPYVLDETQEVARTFGATKTPHVYLLDNSDNEFEVAFIGAIDNNPRDSEKADVKYVENAIAELLDGKPVTKTTAVAIGCTIKWSK
ncbi:MAG: thioredoxin family protein [Cyclobacteriaceae bacterium]